MHRFVFLRRWDFDAAGNGTRPATPMARTSIIVEAAAKAVGDGVSALKRDAVHD
jgi:hypothetical protein